MGKDSDDEVREVLDEFGCTAPLRARGEEAQALQQEAGCKARRWVVERTQRWMKRFRRVLIRWDKKVCNYRGFCIWPVPISRLDNLAY
jgi:putative transposase